jgi:hypothetical protein
MSVLLQALAVRLDDAVRILSRAVRTTALHEWKEGHSQIRQPLDYCWYPVSWAYYRHGGSGDCMGNCPIAVQLLCQIQLSSYARIFLHVIGLGLAVHSGCTCNDILFQICRMGRCTPDLFSPPLPQSPCPSIYPSFLPIIRAL